MVLYGVENGSHVYSKSDSVRSEPYLVITTNVINDEILESVDIVASRTTNIIFQVPLGQGESTRNIHFDFQVDFHKWTIFANRIRFLEFRGMFVDHQFTAKHLECMVSLEGLYIGACNYKLFDHETVSNLPMITCLSLNGYGMVHQSPHMKTWIETLTKNGCEINIYC